MGLVIAQAREKVLNPNFTQYLWILLQNRMIKLESDASPTPGCQINSSTKTSQRLSHLHSSQTDNAPARRTAPHSHHTQSHEIPKDTSTSRQNLHLAQPNTTQEKKRRNKTRTADIFTSSRRIRSNRPVVGTWLSAALRNAARAHAEGYTTAVRKAARACSTFGSQSVRLFACGTAYGALWSQVRARVTWTRAGQKRLFGAALWARAIAGCRVAGKWFLGKIGLWVWRMNDAGRLCVDVGIFGHT